MQGTATIHCGLMFCQQTGKNYEQVKMFIGDLVESITVDSHGSVTINQKCYAPIFVHHNEYIVRFYNDEWCVMSERTANVYFNFKEKVEKFNWQKLAEMELQNEQVKN